MAKEFATCSVIVISIPFLLCSCWMAIWIGGLIYAGDIADSMPIPYYPDGRFLYDYFAGYYSKVAKLYCSLDPIDTVLDYYNDYASDRNYHHYVSSDMKYQSYTKGYSQSDTFLDFVIWLDGGDEIWRPSWTIHLEADEDRIDDCVQGTLIYLRCSFTIAL